MPRKNRISTSKLWFYDRNGIATNDSKKLRPTPWLHITLTPHPCASNSKVSWARTFSPCHDQRLFAGLPHPLGRGKHFRNGIEVLGLNSSRRDSHVGQVFELDQK